MWTRHERSLRWEAYPVEAVTIVDSDDVWEAIIGGKLLRATGAHLVYTGEWVEMRTIGARIAGTHQVVKITVADAHTYVTNGILSHNIKRDDPTETQA
ncbi:Hint domain-containing protein [Sphingomonas melonis]